MKIVTFYFNSNFLKCIKLFCFFILNLWNLAYHHGHQYFLSLLILRKEEAEVVRIVDIFTYLHQSVYYVLGTWGYSGEKSRHHPCTVGV